MYRKYGMPISLALPVVNFHKKIMAKFLASGYVQPFTGQLPINLATNARKKNDE